MTFNLLFAFVFLWFLAFITPDQKNKQDETVKLNSAIVFDISWDKPQHDVDCWIRSLDGNYCGFKKRDCGPFILRNDHIGLASGEVDGKPVEIAKEQITIENKKPGIFQFSLHGYRINNYETIEVVVEVTVAKPLKTLLKKTFEIRDGDEVPVIEFEIDANLNIITVETERLQKFLAELK